MRVFNYSNYAKTLEIAIIKPNMTKIAKALFEPIISKDFVLNHVGNKYTLDSKQAKAWYNQVTDIPKNIKNAALNPEIFYSIADYFNIKIIDELINKMLEESMYSEMIGLIYDSDLSSSIKNELFEYYNNGDTDEFLGKSFLYSIVGDNTKKDSSIDSFFIKDDIDKLKKLMRALKKPSPLTPPEYVDTHEVIYVKELYKVYSEKTGEKYIKPEDLQANIAINKNFNRQRKCYYLAETIRRELRDTTLLDEIDGFDILKDEIYEGIIETHDKDYNFAFDRLNTVIEHVTIVPLSQNLSDLLLNWIGPGEKKGVCHMLVNDKRISWFKEEENDENEE